MKNAPPGCKTFTSSIFEKAIDPTKRSSSNFPFDCIDQSVLEKMAS
jgi:hypothetical protein